MYWSLAGPVLWMGYGDWFDVLSSALFVYMIDVRFACAWGIILQHINHLQIQQGHKQK